jgi:iron complex outermembrane receptor protein
MKIAKRLTVCLCLLWSYASLAQNSSIQGNVKDNEGRNLEFIHVYLKGTSRGSQTDSSGKYLIKNIPNGNYTLMVSSVGYFSQQKEIELTSTSQLNINFILQIDTTAETVIIEGSTYSYVTKEPSTTMRIQTPLIEQAQNIQVISAAAIQDQQTFSMLEGIQRNVSGAQKIEHWDIYSRINMRGSQVTPFRNGVNLQLSPWSPLAEDMCFVDRIEFIKGPASYMLSASEPGGFYNIVTKQPTGMNRGNLGFTVGSFNTYRSTLDLDGKISNKLLFRLNVMGQLKDSHRDFEYQNRYTFAPVLKYIVNKNTSITLEYNEQNAQTSAIGSNYAFSNRGYGDLPVNFTTLEKNLAPTVMRDRMIMARLEHKINNHWKATAQLSYLHYKQVGQSLWPYVGFDASNDSLLQRFIGVWDALGTSKNAQFYVNGDFTTKSVRHRLLAGIDMSAKDYYADWNQSALLGSTPLNVYNPQYGTIATADIPQWDRSKDIHERGVNYNNSYSSLYVQDELGFFENKVRVALAARYTENRTINPYSGNTKNDRITPRASVSVSLDKNTSVYAMYDQVFYGNTGIDYQGNSFDPVLGNNMEIGYKKDWLGGKWNSVVALYTITKNNVLTTDTEHPNPVTGMFVFQRATGQQKVNGVEVDIKGSLTKYFDVIINYAFTDAYISKDSDGDLVGTRVPGASKHIQNTWLKYKVRNGILEGLSLQTGYQILGNRTSWYLATDDSQKMPDYFRWDAGIGYQKDKIAFNLLINNVLNEYLYSGGYSSGMYMWQTEPLRNYRFSVNYTF